MTGTPTIPKFKRSLVGLDDLIAESVSKEGTYHEMFNRPAEQPTPSVADHYAESPPSPPQEFERLQVKVASTVVFATKFEALKLKKSPGQIVELALRQYLNLPPKT